MKLRHFIHMAAVAVAIAAISSLTGNAQAATFTANGGVGSSTVGGVGADYPDLASAAEDFTTGPQAVTGNYTFFITGSTTETRQFTFGKNTGASTITVKPAVGTTATIVFGYTLQNNNSATFSFTQGYPGQFIIGAGSLTNDVAGLDSVIPTNNFVIDGSNTPGGTTRDLTFQTPGAGLSNSRLIFIIGSNNTVVKNCVINQFAAGSPEFGIYVAATKTSAAAVPPSTVYTPTGTVIDNNVIIASAGSTSRPIIINAMADSQVTAANFPANTAPSGFTISNNTLTARSIGIHMQFASSGTISKNVISTQSTGSGVQSGIDHVNTLSSTGWTLNIFDNQIRNLTSSGILGLCGMRLQIGTDTGVGTYNVQNNTISGFNATGSGVFAAYNGILGRSPGSAYNIQHNSINITDAPNNTATGQINGAISLSSNVRASANAVIRNNIIRTAMHGGSGICFETADNTKLVTNGNDVFTSAPASGGATPVFGRFGGVDQATLANWQAATTQEGLGQTVDPAATSGSKWATDTATDLHFVPNGILPVGINGGVATATTGITTDIDGEARNAAAPLPGADEVILGAGVQEWELY